MAKTHKEEPHAIGKATTDLIPNNYAALAVPAQQLTKFLRENIGAAGLQPYDLDKLKVPSGGGTAWEVPTLDGPKNLEVVEGIFLHFKDVRSYWKEAYGGGNTPPDCHSNDLVHGIGDPGVACATCPFAQWGTATNQKGEPTKGQACRTLRLYLFLRQDDMLPMLVVVPPSSHKPAKSYHQRLLMRGLPFYGVTTQLRLTKTKNEGGITYSQIEFSRGRVLAPEEFEKIDTIKLAMMELFDKTRVQDVDVHRGE